MTAVAPAPASQFRWRAVHVMALATLCVAQLIESVDVTVVNVALPAIKAGLGFSDGGLQWVVSAYTVLFGGFLLLGGRCGDLLGKRKVFAAGVAIFTSASLVCGLAPTATVLVAGRAVQGLAAALVAPATLALIATIFPEGKPRDRAMALWGAVTGVSASVGVVAGGLLADGPGWRWIFFVNVPIGVALIAAVHRCLPPDARSATAGRFNIAGAAAVTAGSLGLIYAAVTSVDHGFSRVDTLLPLAAALLCLAFFAVHEVHAGSGALVPAELWRNRSVTAANLVSVLVGSAMLAMFFFMSIYQQQVLHLSAFDTGLNYLPLTGLLMAGSFAAPPLIARIGVRSVLGWGCGLACAGMLMLSRAEPAAGVFSNVIAPSCLVGPGLAFAFVAMTMAAVSGVRAEQAGLAAGLANATRTAGGALGLAVISAVVTSHSDRPGTDAGAGAIPTAFRLSAALMAAAAVCAVVAFGGRRSAESRRE